MPDPLVGIVMGSRSDIEIARKTGEMLDSLDIPYEATVASAHRTPEDVVRYAANAKGRGIRVIIAIAGLSAALPGVVAAHTTLPVLGVPVESGGLGGLDALLSTVQMPPGVPVGSVAINGSANAALLAARIIGLESDATHEKIWEFFASSQQKVKNSRKELDSLPAAPDTAFKA